MFLSASDQKTDPTVIFQRMPVNNFCTKEKKLKYMVFNLLFFFITVTYAQDRIAVTGKVTGGDKQEPLGGALISVPSLKAHSGTTTNNNGDFTILLPAGTYSLLISFLGFESKEISMNTDNPDTGNINLPISGISLNEIIVSASSNNYNTNFKGSNFRVNPVTIRNSNPLNTEEILRKLPGVNIVGDMGLSNRPNISIRGSWGRRSQKILLMEDGSPAAPAPYIAPGAYYNPVSDRIASIEVNKGADMVKYGPNNMYGAINYITALPPQKPELRIKLAGGERGYRTALVSYGGTWDNLGVLVEGVYKYFDGFTDNSSVDILNLNAKIFTKLSEHQSLYFKVSAQSEDNQASLSALTPFTFKTDPTQNPFDADRFTMRRYGLDIIHKWRFNENSSLVSKLYASDFQRDWWRQVNVKILAADARTYLGEDHFLDRFSYLDQKSFNAEDYVRVGRIQNNTESTTNSRWAFAVSGLEERFTTDWQFGNNKHELEVGLKLHQETFRDLFLTANNSRWARSGTPTSDKNHYLWSASGYVRNEFNFGKWSFIPIARFEYIDMYRQDLLELAQNPDLSDDDEGKISNVNTVFLPGATFAYDIPRNEFYVSIYRGFIAPSKVFGFFVERDGVLANPFEGEDVNVTPELSVNTEVGWRGGLLNNAINGQITYFNIRVNNFIAGGETEIFREPGKMNIKGLEIGLDFSLFPAVSKHQLRWHTNLTLLHSKVLEGALQDTDLFGPVIHSAATRNEFIQEVNNNRQAYTLYTQGPQGEVVLEDPSIDEASFATISRALIQMGNGNGKKAEASYTPKINMNVGLDYAFKDVKAGISGNYVGSQYSEFFNFTSESADGAIGKLSSFFTMDAYVNYNYTIGNNTKLNFFINGKNLTNAIYKASRLNRAGSGIFPGGFRQLILGVDVQL